MARLRQQTERIGYPILGVVTQLNQLCRDRPGEYVHWGATTQDITDTATVLHAGSITKLAAERYVSRRPGWDHILHPSTLQQVTSVRHAACPAWLVLRPADGHVDRNLLLGRPDHPTGPRR